MSDAQWYDNDPGDEERPPPAGPKRYYRVDEMTEYDTPGISHHVVARDMMHALEILAKADLSDAVQVEIVEMFADQAAMLRVHDADTGKRYTLAEAELGAHFCEEY